MFPAWKDFNDSHQVELNVIGLLNYNPQDPLDGFLRLDYALSVLVYVIYLNLSVFTRRQMKNSQVSAEGYEMDDYEERTFSQMSNLTERALGTKINLIYLVFKIKSAWPIIDFITR